MEGTTINIRANQVNQSIKVIQFTGKIDTMNSEKLSVEVMKVLEEVPEGLMFDLKEVSFVSSAGLRMFLSAYKKASNNNIKIAMTHVPPSVYKIFKVAGFESAFKVFDNEAQAVKEVWGLDM